LELVVFATLTTMTRWRLATAILALAGCATVTVVPLDEPEGITAADGGAPTDSAATQDSTAGDAGDTGVDGPRSDLDASDGSISILDTDCGVGPPVGPTVDFSGSVMFWTECNVVRAANLDGTGKTTVVTGTFPTGVAIDAVAGKLYWADNGTDTINRADLDGGAAEVLYTSADRYANPNGVAIDHAANRIFWTEHSLPDGGAGYVKSAALDGTNPVIVYTALFPIGVAAAPTGSELFFTDNGPDTVTRGDYAGGGPFVLHATDGGAQNPAAVAVDEARGLLFWTEPGGVFRMPADGGAPTKVADAGYSDGVTFDPNGAQLYFTDNLSDTVTRIGYDGGAPTVVHQAHSVYSNPRGVAVLRR
jgi:sugar lactone lactonase YvrE